MVGIPALLLDPRNPRLLPSKKARTPRDILAELVEFEKVYDLAKDIAERGYTPVESLIGIKEGKQSYVVEGNRRLAALKLLTSPEQAPEDMVAKFRKLQGKMPKPVEKVRVLYAPSRREAAGLILHKHTRDQVKRWDPLMQARFYKSLLTEGTTIGDIAAEHGLQVADVVQFFRLDDAYKTACMLELPAEDRKIVHDPRAFPASVLERLIDSPAFRRFLGIDFDDKGKLKGSIAPQEFKKGFARVISDIAQKKIDTRKLNKAQDIDDYLKRIADSAPDTSKKGAFTSDSLAGGAPPREAPPKARGSRKTTRSNSSSSLIPSRTKCTVENQRVQEVFTELKGVGKKLDTYPNTVAVMLRILLELAVGHYLTQTGEIKELRKAHAAKKAAAGGGTIPKTWAPTLKQMLQHMLDSDTLDINAHAQKKLQKLMNERHHGNISVDKLDDWVHGQYEAPTSRELLAMWSALDEIFAVVLQEPAKEES